MASIYKFYYLIILALLLSSCYPDAKISPAETDTVSTSFVSGTDFSEFKFYRIADSVMRLDQEGNTYYDWGRYDEFILNRLDENLKMRGYLNVIEFPDSIADFNVIISDLSSIQVAYYWSYIPYGSFYWGNEETNGFYPLPPPDYMTVSSISYFMVDILEAHHDKISDIPIYWRGVAQGFYPAEMETRLANSIDIMFIQSPYLSCLEL